MSVSASVFDNIEEYAPGFKASVVGRDILTPSDLERIFGLTGGVSYKYILTIRSLQCKVLPHTPYICLTCYQVLQFHSFIFDYNGSCAFFL